MDIPKFDRVIIRTISPEGWPLDFELVPEPGKTREAIKFLDNHGYRPAPAGGETRRDNYEWTPDGLPLCPKHGEAMRKREKQGDTWFSHSVVDDKGQEHYCRGYPGKSSPGWNL
jgi:hypothetical protein